VIEIMKERKQRLLMIDDYDSFKVSVNTDDFRRKNVFGKTLEV